MNNKIKIAVLDTGIDKNHDYLKNNIIGGISFKDTGDYITMSKSYDDDNGHGTACASVIKKEFQNIEIYTVKILDKLGQGNEQMLEEGLKYLLRRDIRLINLSLSVIESENIQDLYKICDKLSKEGKIIISSLANGYEESYPAKFDNVIGVKGFILEDEDSFWYNKKSTIQCIIDDNPYLSCTINNSYKLFGKCNSKAAAKLTGKVAKILSEKPNITYSELQNQLQYRAKRNYWTNKDLLKSKRYPDFKEKLYREDDTILIDTIGILKETLSSNIDNRILSEYSLFNKNIGLTYNSCFEVIKRLEEKFDIKFNYNEISRYDFVSINALTELVKKNLKYK